MSDTEIEAAVHESFVRQARSAPGSAGLLVAVRARSRRRRARDLVVGGVATVLVVAGVFAGVQSLRSGGRSEAAAVPAPGVFAADELSLCLKQDEVVLTIRTGNDVETAGVSGDQLFHVHVERAEGYTLRLDVLRGSPPPLTNSRAVAGGRIGDDNGDRVLYLGTGVGDAMLRLSVEGRGPSDTQLLGWAQKITTGTDC